VGGGCHEADRDGSAIRTRRCSHYAANGRRWCRPLPAHSLRELEGAGPSARSRRGGRRCRGSCGRAP